MPLVTRTFQDTRKYWVTLSFPDLPEIYCLDEAHGRFRGIPLEEALGKQSEQNKTLTEIAWEHEHFITVIWQALKILDFDKTLKRLKTVLGPIFPNRPIHADYGNPGPASLCRSSHWRAGKVDWEKIDQVYETIVEQGERAQESNPESLFFFSRLMDDEVEKGLGRLPEEFLRRLSWWT